MNQIYSTRQLTINWYSQNKTNYVFISWKKQIRKYKYGDARQEWMKLLRKFDPTTGASKKILRKQFTK